MSKIVWHNLGIAPKGSQHSRPKGGVGGVWGSLNPDIQKVCFCVFLRFWGAFLAAQKYPTPPGTSMLSNFSIFSFEKK